MRANVGRHFVVADVHGHHTALQALLSELSLTDQDQITFLGDLIDHGPDSRGVLDCVISLGTQARSIMGNHETLLLASMKDLDVERHWLRYGGDKTLSSFGVESAAEIPKHYTDWLSSFPLWIETDEYVFVHAGVDSRLDMTDQTDETLLWQHQSNPQPLANGKTVVSGHTPRLQPLFLPHFFSLDTGIANGGLLTAIELPLIAGSVVEKVVQVDVLGELAKSVLSKENPLAA